ncbi:hypothetical protein OPQ81_005250 [Rhizoctonia solani]|nr:hypothetical protein OPQ81_005250 [Rhizoctonia solani]
MPFLEQVGKRAKEKIKQVGHDIKLTGQNIKLFSKDKAATRPNTPSGTQPHTSTSGLTGQADDPSSPPPIWAPTGLAMRQINHVSDADDRLEQLPQARSHVEEVHSFTTNPSQSALEIESRTMRFFSDNRALSNEQMTSQSPALGHISPVALSSHNKSNVFQSIDQSTLVSKPRDTAVKADTGKGIKVQVIASGILESAKDVLKFGPLQDISDMLQGFADTYVMEGAVRNEYETLYLRLQTTIKGLESHCEDGISPTIVAKIQGIREFIEKELNSISNKQKGTSHGRHRMAKEEEEKVLGLQPSNTRMDTSISIWKMGEQQAKALIDRLPSSPSAWFNSNAGAELKRRECTPGTRVNVLANLLAWANSYTMGIVYWLNGMAGTGKTTIAYSLCTELANQHQLAASFFCSRLRDECRNVNMIIPSIAYQLAKFSSSFQSALLTVLEEDNDAHHRVLDEQFETLIRKPLLAILAVNQTFSAGIVVIDALDECENKETTRAMLGVLLNKTTDLPIKFIVSSRPEPQIRDQMTNERVKSRLVLHELDTGDVQADIKTYLREELKPMKLTMEELEVQIAPLVEKAGILFIYAATAVRYIGYDNFQRNPMARLRTLLKAPQGQTNAGNKEIDQLYTTILEAALGEEGLEDGDRFDMQQVLHTVICAREPLTVRGLAELLQINDVVQIRAALRPLWSILHVVGASELVTTLHASFPDFLLDSSRSKAYHCDSEAHNHKLAGLCLAYIEQTQPQFNICQLDSSHLPDHSVPDIKHRVEEAISSELLYACRYWADHVQAAKRTSSMAEQLLEFLSKRLLLWMEVLNLKGQMKAGMECMKLTAELCNRLEGQPELGELAQDAKRFVEAFALNPVSQSTAHIYVSMLTFWPRSRPMAKHYARFSRGPVKAEGTALDRRQQAHLSTWAFDKGISAMSVSPDGSHIALGIGEDVVVVDSSSGRTVLGPLETHQWVRSLGFSSDGTRLFSASYNYESNSATILGWDTRTSDVVLGPLQLDGHTDKINCLGFSPDCTRIATGSDDKTVRLWDAENGKMLHCLSPQDRVYSVVFSPDGTRVAASPRKTLYVWDTQTGHMTLGPLTHTDYITSVAFSADSSRIVGGTDSRDSFKIHVWDAQSGDTIFGPIQAHTDHIQYIGCSPDGKYIVSGSEDRTIRIWDARNGNMILGPLEAHTGWITSVAFSPDSSRIISACYGRLVCTWDIEQPNTTPRLINSPPQSITCVKFSSDGTYFVSGSKEGTICTWDARTGDMKVGPIEAHTDRILAVDILNDRVVSGSYDGTICVCDAVTGQVVLGPLQVSSWIEAVAYSPDGKLIATGSDHEVNLWDAQNGSLVLGPLTDLDGLVLSVRFSPDGTRIVGSSMGSGARIVVWDVSDGKNLFGSLDGHSDWVRSVSYSPNGALIASGSSDGTIIVWNAYTGEMALPPLTAHSDWVLSVDFSPDSTRLVSGSNDRTIQIWDVQTGEIMFELLYGHESSISSVEYSPDGTQILSLCDDDDMNVRIHDARSPDERARSGCEVGEWTINKDGWVVDDQSRLLVWVPGDLRRALWWPSTLQCMVAPQGYVRLMFDNSRMGESWAQSYTSEMYLKRNCVLGI